MILLHPVNAREPSATDHSSAAAPNGRSRASALKPFYLIESTTSRFAKRASAKGFSGASSRAQRIAKVPELATQTVGHFRREVMLPVHEADYSVRLLATVPRWVCPVRERPELSIATRTVQRGQRRFPE